MRKIGPKKRLVNSYNERTLRSNMKRIRVQTLKKTPYKNK